MKGKSRSAGRCSMKGSCGQKSFFSPQLPCPVHQSAQAPDEEFRSKLINVCGQDFASGDVCCTSDQVDSLKANLEQAEPLVSACPSCRNNFRSFFCSFTCSPNQSQFLDVSSTQEMSTPGPDGSIAVKSVEFHVGEDFKKGFFESCKDVKFGASNGFIMDLIGGGAKDPDAFLKFMGDEKPLVGSPFQINFPKEKRDDDEGEGEDQTLASSIHLQASTQLQLEDYQNLKQNQSTLPPIPFNPNPRNCDDQDLLSLCACTDCPKVCPILPSIPIPNHKETCQLNLFGIKTFSCFTISLSLIYLLALTGFLLGYGSSSFKKSKKSKRMGIRHRNSGISVSSEGSGYERVRLSGDEEEQLEDSNRRRASRRSGETTSSSNHRNSTDSSLNGSRGLVGSVGLGGFDNDDIESRGMGNFNTVSTTSSNGISDQINHHQQPLNALSTTQPRSYILNTHLTNFFYKLGLRVSRNPLFTFMIACVLIAVANLGWLKFQVETDPVKLWVSKSSESKLRKEHFDENFGPFYKVEQVFLMDSSGRDLAKYRDRSSSNMESDPKIDLDLARPVLNWEVLKWWSEVEKEISSLKSYPNGYQLSDVCFAPTGTECVVQSILGYFSNDLDNSGVNEENWKQSLDSCTDSPVECLPLFGQPLERNIVLGGIPQIVKEPIPGGNEHGGQIREREGKGSDARSLVTSWILNNSLNQTEVQKIEEWERELEKFLFSVAGINLREPNKEDDQTQRTEGVVEHALGIRRRELGVEMAISTGVSLEEEIGGSSNTDVGIVVLSYLLMFLYAALALGGGGSSSLDRRERNAFRAEQSPHGASLRTGLAGRILSFLPNRNSSTSNRNPSNAGLTQPSLKNRLFKRLFINSKFSLGLFGILIVLISVTSAVGIFSAMGIKVTLVIAEVIPFLVLAIGVDNIFLLSNEMDRQTNLAASSLPDRSQSEDLGISRGNNDFYEEDSLEDDDEEDDDENAGPFGSYRAGRNLNSNTISSIPSSERAARALSRMGPSILLSATTQVTAFLLGALVPMPAVRNFALYAAGSMFLAAILQCTVFVAAMALDADRTESNRLDCLPCLRIRTPISLSSHSYDYSNSSSNNNGNSSNPDTSGLTNEGLLSRFIRRHYAPFLLKPIVKKIILALFAGTFTLSLIGARKVKMGLDQRLALPTNSYLRDYFDSLDTFLDVGPPVYFVALSPDDDDSTSTPNGASMSPSLSPSLVSGQRSLCGRFTTCQPLSLANILEGERKRPESSFIAQPASSWFDDFFGWLNPALESCCRVKINDPDTFCSQRDSEFNCQPCFQNRESEWNITLENMPENQEFYKYLNQWLISPSDAQCPLGGQAAYSSAISLKVGSQDGNGDPNLAEEGIKSSHFRTYHTPLRTQDDFIDALASAERISKEIKQSTGVEVYAYSLFYVFFDQYLSLTSLSFQVLGSSLLCIFLTCTFLLGSWRTSLVVTVCVFSVLISIFGTMGFLGINLNALTLVNLDVCAAIAVEFCAHLSRAFMRAPGSLPRLHPLAQKERDERTWAALADVGSSVLSGITGTKLVGISVLAFTRSELLKLYYAQMWFALILIGVTHGLILLPVLLSYFGGRGYASGEEENEVRHRLLRANDSTEYRPFVSDEVEDGSDDEL